MKTKSLVFYNSVFNEIFIIEAPVWYASMMMGKESNVLVYVGIL